MGADMMEARGEGRYYLLSSGAKVYERRRAGAGGGGGAADAGESLWLVAGGAAGFDPDPESERAVAERVRASREMVPVGAVGELAERLREEGRLFVDAAGHALVRLVEEYERRLNLALDERGINLLHGSGHVTIEFDEERRPTARVKVGPDVYLPSCREMTRRMEDYFGGDPDEEDSGEGVWWAASEWLWTVATSTRMERILGAIAGGELPQDRVAVARAFAEDFPGVEGLLDPDDDHYLILTQRLAYEYLDALPLRELSAAQIEALIGLSPPGGASSEPVPTVREGHFSTSASLLWQRTREVVAQGSFEQVEGSPWPTADITSRSRKVCGSAVMMPPRFDNGTYMPPAEAQAWAEIMWRQREELSDLDADLLDALCAVWLSQASDPRDGALATVDGLLRMRGVKPKLGGAGRRGGYESEQREAVMRSLARLENVWLTVSEMEVYDEPGSSASSKKKGRRRKIPAQSRAFVITDRVGQMRLDGGMEVDRFRFRPGDIFAHYLGGAGRQVALLSAAALAYDPYREVWEKRLAKYLSWRWKAGGRSGHWQPHKVLTLLDRAGQKVNHARPLRTRERLEKSLDRLHRDGVIADWQYDRFHDRFSDSRKGWVERWLASTVVIEPPDVIKGRTEVSGGAPEKGYVVSAEGGPAAPLAAPPEGDGADLARRVRERRKEAKLSQMRLAERLGVSQALISMVERGKETPSAPLRRKLEAFLEGSSSAPGGNPKI